MAMSFSASRRSGPFHFGESPYPISDPVKILALVSSIAFAAGFVIILFNRFAKAGKAGIGSYFDWIFLVIVFGVGATGHALLGAPAG